MGYLVLAFVLIPLLCCGGLASWWFGRQAIAQRKVDQVILDLEESGLPVDNESMSRFRAGMTKSEDAQRWMSLLDLLESKDYTESTNGVPVVGTVEDDGDLYNDQNGAQTNQLFPEPGQAWEHEEAVRKFLARWSEQRKELHALAEGAGPVRTHVEFDSYSTLLPYVQASRSAARLLTLEHRLAVQQNDGDQCFHCVMGILGTARTLESEPVLVSQLVRHAIAGMGISCLQRCIEHDLLSDQQLRAINDELVGLDDFSRTFALGIAGERAMAITAFDDLTVLGEKSIPLGGRSLDRLASLEFFASAENIGKQDLDADAFLDALQDFEQEFNDQMTNASPLRRFDTVVTSMTCPAVGAVGRASVRMSSRARLARLCIRVRLYEHQLDGWPESLDDLQKLGPDESELKPTGGKPFGYRVIDGKAYLWGFIPETSRDQTPPDPAEIDEEDEAGLKAWNWVLQR